MLNYFHKKLSSDSVWERVIYAFLLFMILFFGVTILSYYFLPEGLLKNKNPLQQWETSVNTFILIFQIFFYNMISVLVIVFGSLFGQKKELDDNYLSIGYLGFFTMICINATVLGTWSFSVEREAVPLLGRIIRTFDLIHRAGLWEMTGQLFITCAIAHISTVLTSGKNTVTRKIRDIQMTKEEKLVLIIGLLIMFIGAVIEGNAINTL
ncbi:hypothetical protein Ana3638_12885 [Anaerocolumna sedimenticola]|uniref:Uncharacterized protein n=1 Tax=Anaerocolumna sedimenticola TaxID=2696063 RepID=A0A6P1TNU9_9FIRM|nr:stage II sporulation protein M [Anaerocolumna sedimenticola]QHQ61561.1 hypothetical protein Ana3638_12885 [Anaerocolumna sedimenticola]